jgi:hypothetical protein
MYHGKPKVKAVYINQHEIKKNSCRHNTKSIVPERIHSNKLQTIIFID